jgi:ankyrin repeat protein
MEEAWNNLVNAYKKAYELAVTKNQRNALHTPVFVALESLSKTMGGMKQAEMEETLRSLASENNLSATTTEAGSDKLNAKLKEQAVQDRKSSAVKNLLEKTFHLATTMPAVTAQPSININNLDFDPLNQLITENSRNPAVLKQIDLALAADNGKIIKELFNSNPSGITEMLAWNLPRVTDAMENAALISQGFLKACEAGNIDTVEKLFNRDKRIILAVNSNRLNGLALACEHGQLDVAKFMLDKVDRLAVDKEGMMPFGRACKNGHVEIVKYFLEQKAFDSNAVNKADRNNFTPLDHACAQGNTAVVKLLLAAGAVLTDNINTHMTKGGVPFNHEVTILLTEKIISERKSTAPQKPKVVRQSNITDNAIESNLVTDKTIKFLSTLDPKSNIIHEIRNYLAEIPPKYRASALRAMIANANPVVLDVMSKNQAVLFTDENYQKRLGMARWDKDFLEEKVILKQQEAKKDLAPAVPVVPKAITSSTSNSNNNVTITTPTFKH